MHRLQRDYLCGRQWLGMAWEDGGRGEAGREEGEAAVWNERSKVRGRLWRFFEIFWSDLEHTER